MRTVPLAGGTVLNQPGVQAVAAVDLQELGLNTLSSRGSTLVAGAAVSLQALLEALPAAEASTPALRSVLETEASYNLRQVGTVAGTLVASDGRSPFATALLALDAQLEWKFSPLSIGALSAGAPSAETGQEEVLSESLSLGEFLLTRQERLAGRLITQVTLPLNVGLFYEAVARTPADRPIVAAAVAVWPSGRTRVALGGYGVVPLLALDGPEPGGAAVAARNAFSQAGDEWASAAYRADVAAILVARGVEMAKV
jgi:CO/xanthine dehydrogenase FAD-binding subunit